jgi:hypothetical protein
MTFSTTVVYNYAAMNGVSYVAPIEDPMGCCAHNFMGYNRSDARDRGCSKSICSEAGE